MFTSTEVSLPFSIAQHKSAIGSSPILSKEETHCSSSDIGSGTVQTVFYASYYRRIFRHSGASHGRQCDD